MADPVRAARQELQRVGLRGDVRAIEGTVPEVILRSWRRSIGNRVDSDIPTLRYQDVDTDSILCRAADPVLDRWQDRLLDTGTTLFLSDRAGSIVARRASDSSLRRRLDTVHAAEGFDYSEDSAGTNGLGTAIVEGRGVYIQGSQHYKDALSGLSCAAVPVSTPTGVSIGAVSLGGSVEAASPLMLSLTREIGQQIEERLRASARPQDLALALSFTRFTNSRRPTVVMDGESILANTPGLPYVNVDLHVALWETLSDQDWRSSDSVRLRVDELSAEVVARRVTDGPRAHFVLHFDAGGSVPGDRGRDGGHRNAVLSPAAPDQVVSVLGPPGSGRAEQARQLHALAGGRSLLEWSLDDPVPVPWAEVDAALGEGRDVLLRRAEALDGAGAARLVDIVTARRSASRRSEGGGALLVTACPARSTAEVRAVLDGGTTHRTASLASTPDRIPGIVRTVLDRVDADGRRTMSPAALQDLMRWRWPGELTELVATVTELVNDVSGPVIERHHLPARIRNASPRRQLSLIEEAERSAIVRALQECHGNKSEAATMLGIGRTTLYRRLKQLGLEPDEGLV